MVKFTINEPPASESKEPAGEPKEKTVGEVARIS